jgi:hypothetical protein
MPQSTHESSTGEEESRVKSNRTFGSVMASALALLRYDPPTGLVMRLHGKDLFRLKREPDAESCRVAPRTGTGDGNEERSVLMLDFLAELWRFMRVRKKFWLLPILIMMVVFGGLAVLTKGSALAPFIYTLF